MNDTQYQVTADTDAPNSRHLFTYSYKGDLYSFEIVADSVEEAHERVERLVFADYAGVLVMRLPGWLGWLAGPLCWFKNTFAKR